MKGSDGRRPGKKRSSLLMTTRRRFLAATGPTLAIVGSGAAPSPGPRGEKPLLSFGLMADCQYADTERVGSRFYRESPRKLTEAVRELNQHELAFAFHLGDFIDRDFKSFAHLKPITARLRCPLHHALGNHDFDVAEELKDKVPAELGLRNTYYAIRQPGFRFLVIDTTEVSTYRHGPDDARTTAAHAELRNLSAAKRSYAQSWNSRASDAQVTWLSSQLEEADAARESVLVLGHHPILPEEAHGTWNRDALHDLFRKHPCCKAYLNGHRHSGGHAVKDGVHYLTMHGMLDTAQNAFATARLFPSRLEIRGFGRQPSHTLEFR